MSTAAIILTLHLNVILHLPVESEDLRLARETALALLDSAEIGIEWQECSTLMSRCEPATGRGISVRLLPRRVTGRPECGHLIRDPKHGTAALVYVVRHRELAQEILHSPAGRSHPALSSLRAGHVTGLTIAHEVGHALNLPHTRRGVMKAWIDVNDLLALRESRLEFTPEQSALMREAMLGWNNEASRVTR